jgi:hypothetical protein
VLGLFVGCPDGIADGIGDGCHVQKPHVAEQSFRIFAEVFGLAEVQKDITVLQ